MRKIFIKNFAEEIKINLNNEDNVNPFIKIIIIYIPKVILIAVSII